MATVLYARKFGKMKNLGHEPTVTLPDGRTLTAGMVITITGVEGQFTFRYGRFNGKEVTCWGGVPKHEAWRSFRPDQVASAGPNLRVVGIATEAAAAVATSGVPLTPGQKAALTKRLRAAAASAVAA